MAGTRMIICDCGFEAGPDQLAQYLAECGAEVGRQYQLISGVAAGTSAVAFIDPGALPPTIFSLHERLIRASGIIEERP